MYHLPLPYAGIIQVRYKGRPIGLDISAKRSPSLVEQMLTLNVLLSQ